MKNEMVRKGFTLIELVVVIAVVSILAIAVLPRFAKRSDFDQAGYRDQVVSALQFARKIAVAQRRAVCVTVAATGVTFSIDRDAPENTFTACEDPLVLPGASSSCGMNAVCAPSGVTLSASTFRFTALGQATAAVTITITGGSNILVDQETGYAR